MMRTIFISASMALLFLGLHSCSDDLQRHSGKPVEPGTEIQFGAAIDARDIRQSRTIYGDEQENGSGGFEWPIYWRTDVKDHVYIYSPTVEGERNQAEFTVNPSAASSTQAETIDKVGDHGIQAGAEASSNPEYTFYGLYPASALLEKPITGSSIHATIPVAQDVTFDGNGQSAPYTVQPDMNNCLMTATRTQTISAEVPVSLQFKPFSTVLDITINGLGSEAGDSQKITGVVIQAGEGEYIAGDFNYDYANGTITPGSNASNEMVVNIKDEKGTPTAVTLARGETLTLQAFLIPNPNVKSLSVTVWSQDSKTWKKVLKLEGNSQLVPHQIHKVKLPALTGAGTLDFSRWIAQMDPRTYISELSMAGSTASFSQNVSEANNKLQTLSIAEQFNAGIRVFQAHAWYNSNGTIQIKSATVDANMTLTEALKILQTEMAGTHKDEFCVLMLSDYGTGQITTFYQNLRTVLDNLVAQGIVADNITPNTTIKDVKGKIIVKLQMNASNWSFNTTGNLNTNIPKIQTEWAELEGSKALLNYWTSDNGSTLFYCPMTYGTIGKYSLSTEFNYKISGLSSVWTKGVVTPAAPGLAVEAANIIVNNSAQGFASWHSSINPTSVPSYTDGDKMWYVYAEQAEAGANYNNAIDNIDKVTNAISSTFANAKANHNIFYMTYVGGNGGTSSRTTYTVNDITKNFIARWNSKATWTDKPFGWVLFNEIPAPGTSTTENVVAAAVAKVINQNLVYTPQHSNEVLIPPIAPSGDVPGTENGGSLFGK